MCFAVLPETQSLLGTVAMMPGERAGSAGASEEAQTAGIHVCHPELHGVTSLPAFLRSWSQLVPVWSLVMLLPPRGNPCAPVSLRTHANTVGFPQLLSLGFISLCCLGQEL